MTIRDQIVAARAHLIAAHIPPDEAARDAALLARHALGWDAATLVSNELERPPDSFAPAFAALIERRSRREPVAYIRGVQEFWARDFTVCSGVLIPRPETELIIEEARYRAARGTSLRSLCDVGTGSGCLAVTMAAEFPDATVVATDVSPVALTIARANAERHHVGARIDFRLGAYFAEAAGPFDVIVSNPPYISDRLRRTLPPEVREFEPPEALLAGADGLREIRELVRRAPDVLRLGGYLIFEIGHDQSERVGAIVGATRGLRLRHVRADLQGYPRLVVAQRRADL